MRKTQLVAVHVGQPATVKDFGNDKAVINFNVADTEHYTNKEGTKIETTTWIECKWFMPAVSANKMAAYLTKGKKLYLEGKSEARAFIDKEGKAIAVEGFLVKDVVFLDSKKDASTSPAGTPAPTYTADTAKKNVDIATTREDDDLPF